METRNPDLTKKLISALAALNLADIQKAYNEGARFNHVPMNEHPFREFDASKRMTFFAMVATLFSAAMRNELFSWLIQRSRVMPVPDADLYIPEPHLRAMNNQEWDSDSQLKDRFGRRPVSYYFAYGYLHDPDYISKLKSIRFEAALIKDGFDGKAQLIRGFKIYLENCTEHDIDLNETQGCLEDSLARCLLANEAYEAFLNLVKIQLRKDGQQRRRIIDVNHIYSKKTTGRNGKTVYEQYVFLDQWLDFIGYKRSPVHEEVFSYFKLIDLYLCGRLRHYNILNQVVYVKRVEWIDLLLSHCTGVDFNVKAMKAAPDGKSVVADIYSIAAWLVRNDQASVLAKHVDKATAYIDLSAPFSRAKSRNLRYVIRMKGNPDGLLEKIGTLNVLRFPSSLPVLSRPAPSAAITREPSHEIQLACASSSSSDDSSRRRALRKKKKSVVKHSTVDTVPANKTVEPDQPPSVNYEAIKRSLEGAFSFISNVEISLAEGKFIITFPESWTVSNPDNDDKISFFPDHELKSEIINRIRKILTRHCNVSEGKIHNQLIMAGKELSVNNDFNKSMSHLHESIYNLLHSADKKSKAQLNRPTAPCSTASSSPEPLQAAAELPDIFRHITGLQLTFYFLLTGHYINDGKDYCVELCHARSDSYGELLRIFSAIADVINARLGDTMCVAQERPKMKIMIRTSALEDLSRLKRSNMAGLARDYDIRIAVPADPAKELNTSDHTYRSAFFHVCGANGQIMQTYSGFTWNLLNRCVVWNNPWKRTEEINQYLDRKERQLNKIMRLIERNKPDFFFMQEVDIFSTVSPDFITPEHATRYTEIKQRFYNFVHDRMSIRRQEYAHGIKRKPLVTLYNPNRLEFISENTQFGGAGFECVFKVKAANAHLSLINLHLFYGENANEEIAVYLKQLSARGHMAFIGGDYNSADHPDIHVNPHCVTNIAATTVYKDRKPVCMITDKDEEGRNKAYDGFGAAAGSNHSVIIMEEEGEVFLFDERSQEYKVAAINPQARYPSSCTHEIRPQSSQQTTRGVQFHQSSQQKPPTDTPSAPQYTYKK